MRTALLLTAAAITLTGCSSQPEPVRKSEMLTTYDVAEPPAPAQAPPADVAAPPAAMEATKPASPAEGADPGPLEVSLPQLAYAYKLAFRLPGEKIAAAQDGHRLLCEKMGPAHCQLMGMSRGMQEDQHDDAVLTVRVASAEARRFSDAVTRQVSAVGGRAVGTSVTAEDVSKDIVDATARIQQRELLVARLTDILRGHRGTVSELVEAERSVATAQEELDKAKGWLTELRSRVAMSDVEIRYAATAPTASPERTGNQLGEAFSDSGVSFLIALRGLATLLIYLLPWLIFAFPLFFAARWAKRRWLHAAERSVAEQTIQDDA
jgi:hypothetical protein